jgi:hypothetical protein
MVALVLIIGLGVLRVLQGSPPVESWGELQVDPRAPVSASADPGDQIRIIGPGDTLWGVATELAPGADPRPVADRLVEANGGTDLAVGQRLVIPSDLVDRG